MLNFTNTQDLSNPSFLHMKNTHHSTPITPKVFINTHHPSPITQHVVNYFQTTIYQHIIYWHRKEPLLAFRRCPFETEVSTFWSRTKHLYLNNFIISWSTDNYKPHTKPYFCTDLQPFYANLCKWFSEQ